MTFDEWWKQMKPAECDELKSVFVECWALAVAAERERCAKIVEDYSPGGSYHIRTALAAEIRRA